MSIAWNSSFACNYYYVPPHICIEKERMSNYVSTFHYTHSDFPLGFFFFSPSVTSVISRYLPGVEPITSVVGNVLI